MIAEVVDALSRRPARDAFEVGLTWFIIGALCASFWYVAIMKIQGWIG
jgi:uncharacterized membrane protein YhhN